MEKSSRRTFDPSSLELGAESPDKDVLIGLSFVVGRRLCSGEDVAAEGSASVGRYIVVLCYKVTNYADDRGAVGINPDDIGAAADLPVEAFIGVVMPDALPELLREPSEYEDV